MNCPFCDFVNIEGADVCEQCGQPLTDLHLRDPQTVVEQGLLTDCVQSLGPKPLISVTPTTTVAETLDLLVSQAIGCVFVVNDGQVVGVFSERDALLRLNTEVSAYRDRPIADFMTPNPHCLGFDAKVGFAVQQMDLGGYRHIPIVDEQGSPQGVISVRDILNYLAQRMTGDTPAAQP